MGMNKITNTFIIICFTFLSCGDPIEDNRRIAFEVKVADENNQPLSDIDVNVAIFRRGASAIIFSVSSFEGIIGLGKTNTIGEARITSLRPSLNNDKINVIINGDNDFESTSINNDYGIVLYELERANDFEIFLPDVTLRKNATLNFSIDHTSSLDTLSYSLEYSTRIQKFQFPEGEEMTTTVIEDIVFPDSENASILLNTLESTSAIFSYQLRNNGVIASDTIEIPVNQNTVNYVFEF